MRSWIHRSFRNRIFLTVLLVTLLPLLFCDVLMMQIQVLRSESSLTTQAESELEQLNQALEEICVSCEQLSEALCQNTIVRSALREGSGSSRVLYQLLFRVTDELREYGRFDIFNASGQCLYTTDKVLPDGDLRTDWGILGAAGEADSLVYRCGDDNTLMASRAVRSYDGQILGYVVISINQANFDLLFDGLYSSTNDVILLSPQWRTIYHTQPAQAAACVESLRTQLLAGETLTGAGGEYSFHALSHERTGFTILLQQPKTFTTQVMHTVYAVSALMGFLCLLLCMWCAWLLSRHLSQPVNQLDQAMGRVKKGDYDVQLNIEREDELGRLAESFNRMVREYRQNLERSVQRQRELNETQLRMMQAQLNPHFLYNTLDSMKWLGVTHQVPQIATLATDLATILRAGISGGEFITLEQELELIDRYIDIQSIRFEDRFTCEIDVPDRLQSCLVPKLVLQPLVENAIIHGVADLDDGYIKLWAEERDGDLLLSVSDNGCGIPPAVLSQLNSPDPKLPGNHLGLYNVSRIIRLHFGEKYGVSAKSVSGKGSCVQLLLPMRKEEISNA